MTVIGRLHCVAITVTLLAVAGSVRAEGEGKQVFLDHKCNQCHAVKAFSITVTDPDSEAPDLSDVGSRRTAEFMSKYLKKQETIDAKKHGKKFQGDDKALEKLVAWLASLKSK
jgi:cytochrome c2